MADDIDISAESTSPSSADLPWPEEYAYPEGAEYAAQDTDALAAMGFLEPSGASSANLAPAAFGEDSAAEASSDADGLPWPEEYAYSQNSAYAGQDTDALEAMGAPDPAGDPNRAGAPDYAGALTSEETFSARDKAAAENVQPGAADLSWPEEYAYPEGAEYAAQDTDALAAMGLLDVPGNAEPRVSRAASARNGGADLPPTERIQDAGVPRPAPRGAHPTRTRLHDTGVMEPLDSERSYSAEEYTFASDASTRDDYGFDRDAAKKRYQDRQKGSRRRSGVFRKVLIALALVAAFCATGALAYVGILNSNLQEGLDPNLNQTLVKTNLTKEPFYMLLLGTDASLERLNDETYGESFRTDTIILARIDPVHKKATLVSMPRDTMIEMPEYGTQKLNAAYALGGDTAAVQEVSELSGVGISHFCLIDMDGLKQVVDALGGIEVDVPVTIDDEDAGGHVDSGLHTLDGEEALILCRARNCFDNVGAGDSFRSANQRLVLQAVANKILSSDVGTIAKTCRTLSEYVTTDLTVNDLVGLAQAFQGMDTQGDLYTASMPTESAYIDELWYEIVIDADWWYMLDRIDRGLPPTDSTEVDAVTGTVFANAGNESDGSGNNEITKQGLIGVRNGTPQDGLGQQVAEILESQGYTVIDVDKADTATYETTMVIYEDNNQEAQARQIAAALGGAEVVQNDGTYVLYYDFLVVVGADNM